MLSKLLNLNNFISYKLCYELCHSISLERFGGVSLESFGGFIMFDLFDIRGRNVKMFTFFNRCSCFRLKLSHIFSTSEAEMLKCLHSSTAAPAFD